MWLVADSGSTKTEWIFFTKEGKIEHFFTVGLNPLFTSEEDFNLEILNSIPLDKRMEVSKLWFYGAGCGTKTVNRKTESWLQSSFTKAKIEVESDLLGAARVTCGTQDGLVAILGTGSNSCLFEGDKIKRHIKPLGFVLGDEGSGAALGKALLKKLLRNELAPLLTKSIYKEIGMDYDEIIQNVYHKAWPNRFLASCAKVLYAFKSDKEIGKVVGEEFNRFAYLLKKYNEEARVHLVGSVGYYFENEIRISLEKVGLQLGVIVKAPAKALVNYHISQNTN